MVNETSPTARALLALELIQNSPGIQADRLADALGVSERAARRYVGILREAGVPIESVRGRYGGYSVGRGLRLPPLMFTVAEALGLVLAVLEGHQGAVDPGDPVGAALGKITRVLPQRVAGPVEAAVRVVARDTDPAAAPDPDIAAVLIHACASAGRLRVTYRMGSDQERVMEVDPWAVAVRRGRWYLLCWSHTKDARRLLRVDRVAAAEVLDDVFTPPADLDPLETIEAHLAEGWRYEVEVLIDAPAARVAQWIPRHLGRLEVIDEDHTRLIATTDEPDWYVSQLTAIWAPLRIVKPPELQQAARDLGERLRQAGSVAAGS